jgi:putative addiction module component (TIGR02574 family)
MQLKANADRDKRMESRALDLDEPALSAEDEALVERRLEDHRRNPESAVPLEEMKGRVRSRFSK